MSVETINENLFEVYRPTYMAHACNCQGGWGAGIALNFREKYPYSYQQYRIHCIEELPYPGMSFITSENIICLFTSYKYGRQLDSPEEILKATKISLQGIIQDLPANSVVYSNKFNSGLFKVPWEQTEQILKKALEDRPDIDWIVCDYTP